jgi:hypothetical protein
MRSTGTVLGIAVLVGGCYHGGGTGDDPAATAGETDARETDGASDTAETESDTDGYEPPADWDDPGRLGPQGLRRQSIAELRHTLASIAGATPEELDELLAPLPADTETPFDNAYRDQDPSLPLVEGAVALAEGLAARIAADPARRDALLGCTPAGPSDVACLRTFVERFGRLALRRPLSASEVDDYAAFIEEAEEDGDFNVAFALALQALLLDAEFIYQVEVGEPSATQGVVRLNGFEMASRLSFLLLGRGPDDALLDRAEAGELDGAAGVAAAAEELLASSQAVAQVQRMHAMWLSYADLPVEPSLAASLQTETDKLVERALQHGDWTGMFTAEETWLDPLLAEHYDIPLPGGEAGWVEYPDIRRGGLVSHGSFLAFGMKSGFPDTSPTERGKAVWTRLLCEEIPPPPASVDTGLPPDAGGPDACKVDRYAPMREESECSGCHMIIDGIGFGLENYGPTGQWRTVEPTQSSCAIDGRGELVDHGEFHGARALGQALVDTGKLEGCFMRSVYQFAIGRAPEDDPADQAVIDALTTTFEAGDDLEQLLLTFVASDAFRHRVIEEAE